MLLVNVIDEGLGFYVVDLFLEVSVFYWFGGGNVRFLGGDVVL